MLENYTGNVTISNATDSLVCVGDKNSSNLIIEQMYSASRYQREILIWNEYIPSFVEEL